MSSPESGPVDEKRGFFKPIFEEEEGLFFEQEERITFLEESDVREMVFQPKRSEVFPKLLLLDAMDLVQVIVSKKRGIKKKVDERNRRGEGRFNITKGKMKGLR